jgi:putative MFS transporter
VTGPDRSYLRLLTVLLGTATFFEGYDTGIAAIIIPDLAKTFHATTATIGRAASVVNLGALAALGVIALGDRIGRRPLLIATTLLYATLTGLTATAHSLVAFALIQVFARIFLVSELAVAITIATEEFPAERRGRLLGSLSALGAVGLITVAVLYHFFARTSLGWRWLYLVGAVPLLAVAPLRLKLRESRRWTEAKAAGRRLRGASIRSLVAGPYRGRLTLVSALLFLYNFAVLSGSAYWTLFARNERGLPAGTANTFLAAAVVLGIPGYLVAGRLQDRWGRRRTGSLFLSVGMVAGIAAFQVHGRALMLGALALGVFFGLGATSVMNALSSELFPTDVRATSVAVARSVFGTLGASAGLLTVGLLADHNGLIGTVGNSVSLAALALLPAVLLLWRLPETAGRELEEITRAT